MVKQISLGLFFIFAITASTARADSWTVLTPSDFTYLGYYNLYIGADGLDNPYKAGLTFRYVNGDLRLLAKTFQGRLEEFSLAGKNFGDTISETTKTWGPLSSTDHEGLWWDESTQRLWFTHAIDYNTGGEPTNIETMTLNSDGTFGNRHTVSLQNVHAKKVFGGAQAVPTWFQQQYGVGPYVVGWGGYTSILCVGPAALGPMMFSIPNPDAVADGSEISSSNYKTLIDSSYASCQNDWYANGAPTSYDRGVRLTLPLNYYDGGGVGTTPPNGTPDPTPFGPPNPSGNWLSPAPDGLGRWVWGDSYKNTGMWIDTPTKKGFVLVASLCDGMCYYGMSTLNSERKAYELHIYNPSDLGLVADGNKSAWSVKPSGMQILNLPGMGTGGGGYPSQVMGATYDPVTQRMYLLGNGLGYNLRVYTFQVNAGASNPPPPAPQPQPIVGDINLDHIVNSIDYSILNSDWFTSNPRSDLNHDGLVNAIDYSLLNANWFRTW